MTYLINCLKFVQSKPLLRGMIFYSVSYPIASLIQQTFEKEEYSVRRTVKFGLYGSLFVAPTLFGWMKLSCLMWPQNTVKFALIKVSLCRV